MLDLLFGEENVGEKDVREEDVGEKDVREENVGEKDVREENVGEKDVREEDVGEKDVSAAEPNDMEKEILSIISAIKSNRVTEMRERLHFGDGLLNREKIIMENILVFLAIAAEKEESDIALEEDTVAAILQVVSPHINPRRLTAYINWEMDPDSVSGIASSMCKVPKETAETLLWTFFKREIVPTPRLFLYMALSVERSREETIGGMFLSLVGCSLDSICPF